MKKIKLESLKITSFVTELNLTTSKTIKGGTIHTQQLPACDPNPGETNYCSDPISADPAHCTGGTSILKDCSVPLSTPKNIKTNECTVIC